MEIFEFLKKTDPLKFLNKKLLSILKTIRYNPQSFSTEIRKILKKNDLDLSKSQFYRYINILVEYRLASKSKWLKREENFGYSYIITQKGIDVLDFLSENF